VTGGSRRTNGKLGGFYSALEVMDPAIRAAHKNRFIEETVALAWRDFPKFKDRLERAGLKAEEIRTRDDLTKLPPIKLSDPLSQGLDAGDIDTAVPELGWRQAMHAAGFRPEDRVLVALNPYLGYQADRALNELGCLAMPMGMANIDHQSRILVDLKIKGYVGPSRTLLNLVNKMIVHGHASEVKQDLELAFFPGELIAEDARLELKEQAGVAVRTSLHLDPLGTLAYECPHENGLHVPDDVLIEVVEPGTGSPLGPELEGELTVTVFGRARPFIRINTGLRACYLSEPCPCGRTSRRLKPARP